MSLNQYERRLRDHLAGHTDSVFEKIMSGEDLSAQHPNETAAYNNYKFKSENANESAGYKRLND